jgi:hypothetical protein
LTLHGGQFFAQCAGGNTHGTGHHSASYSLCAAEAAGAFTDCDQCSSAFGTKFCVVHHSTAPLIFDSEYNKMYVSESQFFSNTMQPAYCKQWISVV